ncbi:MAG TPA: hypothetical protein VFG20_17815 [Planctomycetaceae bacterium]|jgi:hypothetical protein|nr:hypothetical protein [Planctomycetaceae bacterium]
MKRWLARCLVATLGCGALAVLSLLLSTLLSAGGDASGAKALQITALILSAAGGLGLITLVVLLSWASLQPSPVSTPPSSDPTPS